MFRPFIAAVLLAAPTSLAAQSDWPLHGHTYDNQRFSTLTAVNRSNVAQLKKVTTLELIVPRQSGLEATPIVVGGIMYMTTSYNSVLAFDLRTGNKLWQYDHTARRQIFCCGPVNRGVALAGDRVYMATLDARLIALDAKTGSVVWSKETHPSDSGYSNTMAPLVVGQNVIIGASGGEYGIRGNVSAYDRQTGELRWRFNTVPSPEQGGWWGTWATSTPWGTPLPRDIAAEKRDSARYADNWKIGGAPVWTTPAYDSTLNLIYFGTGNPSPSNDGRQRPGDNLYNNSTIAVDASTGQMRWYVQHIPHDMWDYDIPNPPIIATVDGRKLVLHAGKEGWVYIMDAATGERVRRSEAFVPQENLFVPPSEKGELARPGWAGGANWHPSSFSPQTGYMYVPGHDLPMIQTRAEQEFVPGRIFIGGSSRRTQADLGILTAIDVATGKIAWQSKRSAATWGGTLTTAGGLVFLGEVDGWFRAYDAKTGDVLWSFFCEAGVDSSPITYELDGKQYVAVAAGGSRYGTLKANRIWIFSL